VNVIFQLIFPLFQTSDGERLELPLSAPITPVQKLCDDLIKTKNSTNHSTSRASCSSSNPSAPGTQQRQPTTRPKRYSALLNLTKNQFLLRIIHQCERVQQYESKALQIKCLNVIPLVDLQNRAQNNMKNLQMSYKNKEISEENQDYQIVLLSCLVSWFKDDFFSWVNGPACTKCFTECTKSKGMKASSTPDIDRIEVGNYGNFI